MTLKEYCDSNGFTRKKLATDAQVSIPKGVAVIQRITDKTTPIRTI